MKQFKIVFRFLGFILLLTINNYSTSSVAWGQEVHLAPSQSTAGTFQFESPSGKLLFWRIDVIEALYPEIESRRAQDHTVIWNYSEDMNIIIFSKDFINASNFVPLESPYKGLKVN